MMPCFDGGVPVVREACTEQVTAGNVGVRPTTDRDATQLPRAELAGIAERSERLSPGMSMTQTRLLMRVFIANFACRVD